MKKELIRRILVDVWQNKVTAGQAMNKIQDLVMPAALTQKEEETVLYELNALKERVTTVNESEEEICQIIEVKKTRRNLSAACQGTAA